MHRLRMLALSLLLGPQGRRDVAFLLTTADSYAARDDVSPGTISLVKLIAHRVRSTFPLDGA